MRFVLPAVSSPLLQQYSHGRGRGVGHQGNEGGPVQVSEHGGARQIGFAFFEGSVEFWCPVDGLGTLGKWAGEEGVQRCLCGCEMR